MDYNVKATDLLDLRPVLGHLILLRHDVLFSASQAPKIMQDVSQENYNYSEHNKSTTGAVFGDRGVNEGQVCPTRSAVY
jgi:hypothetical protein